MIASIVFAARSRALTREAFCFDDSEYLGRNTLVLHPSWESARRFVTEVLNPSTVHGYYQPLTMLSLMLDTSLGGSAQHLLPYHLTSLVLHAINTALVFIILYRLFGHATAAGLAALLFGLHPITMEPIPWIADRKTLLSSLFALLSIWFYINYVQARRPSSGPRGRSKHGRHKARQPLSVGLWYVSCLIAYTLSLLSKPTSTMLPFCLLLLDWWPLQRLAPRTNGRPMSRPSEEEPEAPDAPGSRWIAVPPRFRRRVAEKIPMLVIALVSAWVTYESQKRTAVVIRPTDYADPLRFPLILLHNTVFYLQKILVPIHLTPNYGFPEGWTHPNVIAGAIGTPILISLLLLSLRWTRAWMAGWLFFAIMIFPTLGVIGFTNVIASDKYAYLPLCGLLLPVTFCLARWLTGPSPRARNADAAALAALLICYASLGWVYLGHWKNTETLHRYMLSLRPDANVRIGLGLELARQKRYPEALKQYEAARKLAPHYEGIYFDIGAVRLEQGDVNGAIEKFQEALHRSQEGTTAHDNVSIAATHNSLGSALFQIGRVEEALKHYRTAVDLDRQYAEARYNLANVLSLRGDIENAIEWYGKALKIDPDLWSAHKNLAILLEDRGEIVQATAHYEEVLRIKPDSSDVAMKLSSIYALSSDPGLRRPDRAVALARRAVALTHKKDAACLGTLAIAYGEASIANREISSATAARKTAAQAIQVARASGQAALADKIREQMKQYDITLP